MFPVVNGIICSENRDALPHIVGFNETSEEANLFSVDYNSAIGLISCGGMIDSSIPILSFMDKDLKHIYANKYSFTSIIPTSFQYCSILSTTEVVIFSKGDFAILTASNTDGSITQQYRVVNVMTPDNGI